MNNADAAGRWREILDGIDCATPVLNSPLGLNFLSLKTTMNEDDVQFIIVINYGQYCYNIA